MTDPNMLRQLAYVDQRWRITVTSWRRTDRIWMLCGVLLAAVLIACGHYLPAAACLTADIGAMLNSHRMRACGEQQHQEFMERMRGDFHG